MNYPDKIDLVLTYKHDPSDQGLRANGCQVFPGHARRI